jgi:hypothetical protein
MRRGMAALAIAGAVCALLIPATSASASTGRSFSSPEQAGYAVTGGHFTGIESWVRLPDPAAFARETGRLSLSAQFWTRYSVVDLKLTACTDAACSPGGTPVRRMYRPELDVFSRATGTLVCSTAAPAGDGRCPDVPGSFGRARFAPGRDVEISLAYPVPYQQVFAAVSVGSTGVQYAYSVSAGSVFGQARLGVEFGPTPWTSAPFRVPRTTMAVATFDRPKPPPYFAEVITKSGSAAGIASWWSDHEITMTSDGRSTAPKRAVAGRLSDDGYRFTVYLER